LKNIKKERSLGGRKNTFKKKGVYQVFVRSPEFQVDLTSRLVYYCQLQTKILNEKDAQMVLGPAGSRAHPGAELELFVRGVIINIIKYNIYFTLLYMSCKKKPV